MKKAQITMTTSRSFEETFADFLRNKAAKGLSPKTLATYKQHFSAIKKYIDFQQISLKALTSYIYIYNCLYDFTM